MNYQQVRNEAIQMFRDLPNDRRGQLYNAVIANPSTPEEVISLRFNDGRHNNHGSTFAFYMILPTNQEIWLELNAVLGVLIDGNIDEGGLSPIRIAKLYYIIRQEILNMGIMPAPGAAAMPPPDVENRNIYSAAALTVAGFGPGAAAFEVPPPTPADHPHPYLPYRGRGVLPPPGQAAYQAMVVLGMLPAPIGAGAGAPIGAGAGAPANIYAGRPHNGDKPTVGPGVTNVVSLQEIAVGDEMVDFQGERGFGRYYTKATFNALPRNAQGRKKNPATRAPIEVGNVTFYRATGGKKSRKTLRKRHAKRRTAHRKRRV